jgi:saccharopine dehydrogenase-like NADP-dependent oxidoreductase
MKSHSYLIIGYGYFGSRTAEKLLRKDPKPKIIVVNRNKDAVKKVSNLPVEKISYLQRGVERDERKKKGE